MVAVKAPFEMLCNQLASGDTIFERVQAARALKDYSTSRQAVRALTNSVITDKFWRVSQEAAKSLGSMKQTSAFDALRECYLTVKHPKVRSSIILALGEFRKSELLQEFAQILIDKSESYGVRAAAGVAAGKTKDTAAIVHLRNAAKTSSFREIIARGALNGLKEFAPNEDVALFTKDMTFYGNPTRVREAATSCLGKFVADNRFVLDHLKKNLLTDAWWRVRSNACKALSEGESTEAIPDLEWVSKHDINAEVRRTAEECIIMLKQVEEDKPKIAKEAPPDVEIAKRKKQRSRYLEFLNRTDVAPLNDRQQIQIVVFPNLQ